VAAAGPHGVAFEPDTSHYLLALGNILEAREGTAQGRLRSQRADSGGFRFASPTPSGDRQPYDVTIQWVRPVGSTMKRITYAAAAAFLALSGAATPAHADATVEDGKVGLIVKGKGLKVNRAGGWMDGHGTGVRARLYAVYQGSRTDVTGWKDATPVTAGLTRFSDVDWNLKGRTFRHGTWLCIEFNKTDHTPCAKIRR
jgi:hypothetical protein